MPRTQPDPVTTAEAAKTLGVSIRTVLRMAERGDLPPAFKVPGLRGAYLFDPVVVEMVRRQKTSAAA